MSSDILTEPLKLGHWGGYGYREHELDRRDERNIKLPEADSGGGPRGIENEAQLTLMIDGK